MQAVFLACEVQQLSFVNTLILIKANLLGIQACFIGHSFGSIVISWLLNNAPECVGSILLLDPVSLMLQEPDVAHNFLYRDPAQGSAVQAFFKYFVATELHVRVTISV